MKPGGGRCVAVTGATGLVGRALVELLLARGDRVRALARPRPGREPARAEGLAWIEGRLDERDALDELVRGADAIVHLAYEPQGPSPVAGRSDAEHWLLTNLHAPLLLLERTAGTGLRQLVYVSSLAVYGHEPDRDPLGERFARDEDFPLWPRDFYGALRASVEKPVVAAHHAFGLCTSVFRLGCVLGLREPPAASPFAATVAEALRHGEVRSTVGTYALSAGDAAAILAEAVGDPAVAGGVYNTFDAWVDHAVAVPVLERVLGRRVGLARPAAAEPRSPIRNDRLRRRYDRFRTAEAIERLVEGLAERLGGAPQDGRRPAR